MVIVVVDLDGIGGRCVEVAIAVGVRVSSNSEGRSIVSEAWVVGIVCGGEGTHETAKRETAAAIVAIPFIKDSCS